MRGFAFGWIRAPGGCFVAGTLVHTNEGLKPIEEIRVADWVMSHPEGSVRENSSRRPEIEYTYRQVTKTFVHDDQPISCLTYTQPGGSTRELRVTPNHPIWSKKRGWIPVEQLTIGHVLAIGYFGNVLVLKVQKTDETARVYNIEVDEFHTYFVGDLGVWVHNKRVQTDHWTPYRSADNRRPPRSEAPSRVVAPAGPAEQLAKRLHIPMRRCAA